MVHPFDQGRAVNEVVSLLRADRLVRPVFLLGAGASYRAGIPLADEAVKKLARAVFQRRSGGRRTVEQIKPSEWMALLESQPWFIKEPHRLAENFPLAVEHLLVPREFRREVLSDLIRPRNALNDGYVQLADLMLRGLCQTVLTTNFDSLIIDGLRTKAPHIRHIVEVNKVDGDLNLFNPVARNQIVYIHGAVQYYTDRNIESEIAHLNPELIARLRPLLDGAPLVVIGYRGAEASVMNDLIMSATAKNGKYRHGIYWCTRPGSPLHENVERLRDEIGTNFIHLEIEGFDQLLGDVAAELKDEDSYVAIRRSPGSLPTRRGFDEQEVDGVSLDDLDQGLILATLASYCDRLRRAPVTQDNYVSLLIEQGLLLETAGTLKPTVGCCLLFGRDVQRSFPQAVVTVTTNTKQRRSFDGNLVEQFHALVEYLDSAEVNPTLRVKTAMAFSEQKAYPKRALVEAVVNLLVHRDYQSSRFATIEVESGASITLRNPGLPSERVRRQLTIEPDGSFLPVRSVTEIRNLALADIFFGMGPMDRVGSGLTDVRELMRENGGDATFAIDRAAELFRANLLQPRQGAPGSTVARPVAPLGLYITNLLPFVVVPEWITVFRAARARRRDEPRFAEDEIPLDLPLFVEDGNRVVSFADLRSFSDFVSRRGRSEDIDRKRTMDFIRDPQDRRLFVWLIGKHWEFHLQTFAPRGLEREARKHRVYFRLLEGDRTTIVYDSPKRRGVRRDVVKRRGERYIWHENEGVAYAVVEMDGTWAIQLKPFYMFTRKDGVTPLPSFERTARATRRMKFDRTRNVDDDLTFWSRILSGGSSTIQLRCPGVDDLVLSATYETLEVPDLGGQASHATQD